jgi:hypothetical protein
VSGCRQLNWHLLLRLHAAAAAPLQHGLHTLQRAVLCGFRCLPWHSHLHQLAAAALLAVASMCCMLSGAAASTCPQLSWQLHLLLPAAASTPHRCWLTVLQSAVASTCQRLTWHTLPLPAAAAVLLEHGLYVLQGEVLCCYHWPPWHSHLHLQ